MYVRPCQQDARDGLSLCHDYLQNCLRPAKLLSAESHHEMRRRNNEDSVDDDEDEVGHS